MNLMNVTWAVKPGFKFPIASADSSDNELMIFSSKAQQAVSFSNLLRQETQFLWRRCSRPHCTPISYPFSPYLCSSTMDLSPPPAPPSRPPTAEEQRFKSLTNPLRMDRGLLSWELPPSPLWRYLQGRQVHHCSKIGRRFILDCLACS